MFNFSVQPMLDGRRLVWVVLDKPTGDTAYVAEDGTATIVQAQRRGQPSQAFVALVGAIKEWYAHDVEFFGGANAVKVARELGARW